MGTNVLANLRVNFHDVVDQTIRQLTMFNGISEIINCGN